MVRVPLGVSQLLPRGMQGKNIVAKYFLIKQITHFLAVSYAALNYFMFNTNNVKYFCVVRFSMFFTLFEKIQNRITQFLIKLILFVSQQ